MAKATKSVKFNVGGQAFQVSQSLLDSFPNTMISKSASERWTNTITKDHVETPSSTTQEDEIFIERDGEKFRLILDYMRDGKMYLPTFITKEAMMAELLYYCFDDIDPDKVDNSAICNTENLHIIYDTLRESANQALTEVQNEYRLLCSKIAREMQIMNLIAGIFSELEECNHLSNNVTNVLKGKNYLKQNTLRSSFITYGDGLQLPLKDNEIAYCNDKLRSVGVSIQEIRQNLALPSFTVDLKYLSTNDHTLPLSPGDHDSTNDILTPTEGRKRSRSSY